MSNLKHPKCGRGSRLMSVTALAALVLLSACTTTTSSSTSVEDRIRHQKFQEWAERREPPTTSPIN